ncbi:MAG: DUF1284 domain-containing protein [Methylobacterium mesophilicum]|nr:DUF1284 domain-containing protein [Methylobacterium mesophilicum]
MTVRIRPHHLLCMLSYVGKGYSAPFTANYDRIAQRLSAGERMLIVEGPDDICAPLLDEPEAHCRRDSVTERDRTSARDVGALLGLEIEVGTRFSLDPALVRRMRQAFASGETRGACTGCEWKSLCDGIAGAGFRDVRIAPAE